MGLIHVPTEISPNMQKSKAYFNAVPQLGHRIPVRVVFIVKDPDSDSVGSRCLVLEPAASAGHHSCSSMVRPVMPVRSLVNLPPVWWAIYISVLADLLSEGSLLPKPPSCFLLQSQEFSLIHLVELQTVNKFTLCL